VWCVCVFVCGVCMCGMCVCVCVWVCVVCVGGGSGGRASRSLLVSERDEMTGISEIT